MNYLSACSGIEAATVAWEPLGFTPVGFSEIEPFPNAVLDHHYPEVENFGDMTNYKEWDIERPEIVVGGTPCQAFSIAGLRQGMADPRGNLTLTFLGIVAHFRPTWVVWENVPGVLSLHKGRPFGSFLGGLEELGYGWAYRVLDARYFGVPQRRRRVFVVGHIGGQFHRAAAVLFERESLRRDPPPRQEAGKTVAPTVTDGPPFSRTGNERVEAEAMVVEGHPELAHSLRAQPNLKHRDDMDTLLVMAHGQGDAEIMEDQVPSLTCNHEAPIAFTLNVAARDAAKDVCPTLRSGSGGGAVHPAVAFTNTEVKQIQWASGGGQLENDTAQALRAGAEHSYQFLRIGSWVRRLTEVECERLQGLHDNYTQIHWKGKPAEQCPMGHRYKAIGNSFPVPVVRWIGERIKSVEIT